MRESNPSQRSKKRAARPVRLDSCIDEWPDAGFVLAHGPADPTPSIKIEAGRVVELDGRKEEEFDSIDRFIACNAVDVEAAPQAMSCSPLELAKKLFDPTVPAQEVRRLFGGLTPASLVEVIWQLDVLEMMIALRKMRLRAQPANQAHVTNLREHPALLAADAAEAARRGFAEVETTVGVAPFAPLNALAILVGAQIGRPGVLAQAAVEEGVNLRLAMKGLVSYAETLSVYGSSQAFRDGDDTPWSKAFLASAYASRGIKVRFTSGSGSEVLMGYADGHSMLYLEARCLLLVKGAGSQGVQNGAISCIALPLSLPGGSRGVMAENLIAASLGLEVASGNDAMASHSDIRKSAKLMMQFLPGTDFITSGYSVMPRADNLFGGGNFDSDDLEDWTILQRDFQTDAGITPVPENEIKSIRKRAGHAIQAVYEALGFPPISDDEIQAVVEAYDSSDLPERGKAADIAAGEKFFRSESSVLDAIRALDAKGYDDVAESLMACLRQRAAGDYLQPSGILEVDPESDSEDLVARSAINDLNCYSGPGTGYRLEGNRWRELAALPHARDPKTVGDSKSRAPILQEIGPAAEGKESEVVVALSPAFGKTMGETLAGFPHREVLENILAGIRGEGVEFRLVRILHTADCAFIGHRGAQLSGSGIAVGIQSRGTAVLHCKDLNPLDNLELLSQAPNLSLESYRALGQNAARHVRGRAVEPIPVRIDNMARLKHIVRTALFHRREVDALVDNASPVEVELLAKT